MADRDASGERRVLGELASRLEQNGGLLAAGGGDVGGRALRGQQVVDGEGGHQRRLAVAAWQEDDEFALGCEGGADDGVLEAFERVLDCAGEATETRGAHLSTTSL